MIVKRPCYCGKSSRQFRCCDVSAEKKKGWFSCGKICGTPLKGCRHGCQRICHEGACCDRCEVDVRVRCLCGKRKSTMKCCDVQLMKGYDERSIQQIVLECNEECGLVQESVHPELETKRSLNYSLFWIVLCVLIAVGIQFWLRYYV